MTDTQQARDELTSKLKRTEVHHRGSSIPGREIVVVLTEIPHNALDVGPDSGQMLSTYLVAEGAPLARFVDPPPT